VRLVASVHPLACRVLSMADGATVWQKSSLDIGVTPHLTPSGRYLLLFSILGDLEIVDLDSRQITQRSLPLLNVDTVLFDPDDECVLVQQAAGTVRLNWRTSELKPLCEGSPSSISEDGRWLVTVSNARKLVLWELPQANRLATFTLDAPILHTAISPDGRSVVVGDQAGNVHILKREG
jgi:WD40 repeat protein